MKIKPLGDRILVQRVEEAETKKGGIIIPDTAKEKPMQAKIIEVGTGRKDENGKVVPLEVKKGDMVLIGKYAGTDVTVQDKEYLIMREEDVLAIIE
jgi:chaperonin GroES